MSFEIKVINALIKFFDKIKLNAVRIVHELKFMKYEWQFDEREDDIYVATFLKSGTTWMQMILYQLTTNGDMNFEHIYEVSPWLRNLAETEGEIPELPSPRIIKTHDPYHTIAKRKKGRFIFVIRDGLDVAYSLFHHRKNYNDSKITVEKNFEISFREEGEMNWFAFTKQWLENRNKHNILYVHYEALQNNFEEELYRIASFINIEINPADLPRILERCSFDFMKAHENKFGEKEPKEKHVTVYNQFIRSGKVGEGKEVLPPEDLAFYKEQFDLHLSKYLGTPKGDMQTPADANKRN